MLLTLLQVAPLFALAWVVAIVLSLTVHEFAHALVGTWRGDKTAEHMGRLTLNPLAHLDLLGTLMLLTVGFGWAKPVPYDPRNLKNPAWDAVAIAVAGPAANLFLASLAAAGFRSVVETSFAQGSLLPIFLILLVLTNLLLLFFNLIPVPPLDGSKVLDAILTSTRNYKAAMWFQVYGPKVLFGLVILSLLTPINVFGFIFGPAIFACDQMTGTMCLGTLSSLGR
jgi:Zn-dependent protease